MLRLVAVVPGETAAKIRVGLHLPEGVAPRRGISETVRSNIARYVPRCRAQGDLNAVAANYLMGWSTGTLETIPRPNVYEILSYRWRREHRDEVVVPGSWTKPGRKRHIDLTVDLRGEQSSSGDSEGDIVLPRVLLDDRDN